MTVFDAYRASKALEGHLPDGESLQSIAVDDVSGDYWVTTHSELIVIADGSITARYPLDQLRGEVTTTTSGVDVRVSAGAAAAMAMAAFRRPNKVTERLASILNPAPDERG